MDDVFYPQEIQDNQLGHIEASGDDNIDKSYTTEVYRPITEVDKKFPPKFVAHETISSTLDTRTKKIKGEYSFNKEGAILVGGYVAGVSGEIAISPDGIVAKNVNNETTVLIEGSTGDAYFKGTVEAGSVISGDIQLGGNGNDDGYLSILDSSSNELVRIDNTGLETFDTSGNTLLKVDGADIIMDAINGDIYFDDAKTGAYITYNPTADAGLELNSSNGIFLNGGSTAIDIDSGGIALIGNTAVTGTFSATGSKSFKIPHPDKSDRWLVYTCPESPDVQVRVRGKGDTGESGYCEIKLPKHFTLVSDPNGLVTGNLTLIGDPNNNVVFANEPTNESFRVKSFKPNTKFHWEIIAIRVGFINQEIEPKRD